jgi:hypothetical protein
VIVTAPVNPPFRVTDATTADSEPAAIEVEAGVMPSEMDGVVPDGVPESLDELQPCTATIALTSERTLDHRMKNPTVIVSLTRRMGTLLYIASERRGCRHICR